MISYDPAELSHMARCSPSAELLELLRVHSTERKMKVSTPPYTPNFLILLQSKTQGGTLGGRVLVGEQPASPPS